MSDNEQSKIGNRLKFFFKQKGIKTKQVAETLGVHPNNLYKIYSGERGLTTANFVKLYKEYGFDIDYILGINSQTKNNKMEDNEVIYDEEGNPISLKQLHERLRKLEQIVRKKLIDD